MIFIPEVTLYNLLVGCLTYARTNYIDASDKNDTILADIFKGNRDHKKDYFDEAVALIITKDQSSDRYVEIRQFFDASRAKIPTIHITIPQDEDGDNSLAVGQNDQDEEGSLERDGIIYPINSRRFDTQYQIICTSDNHSEVMILYHLIRALLISMFDTISHVGLQNPKLSGQELKINSELSPPHIYMRSLGLRASYEVAVPQWFGEEVISNIILCTTKITN